MKLIKACFQPIMLEDVYSALRHEGFCCMTVFNGEGTGDYINPEQQHGSLSFPGMHAKIVKVEIAVQDEQVPRIVQLIQENAHTGHTGDGIIFVTEIEDAVRINDGTSGTDALL
jgi:nitrogen regulatory protein PII